MWTDRRVLVTGHTGFKGAWLTLWLQSLGAKVTGIALGPNSEPALFTLLSPWRNLEHRVADIRDRRALRRHVKEARPEIVFHLAAQAIVAEAWSDPVGTFTTNALGTAHLLDALES